MSSIILRHCDRSIRRHPQLMERLRYFYASAAALSLAITWTLTILRLSEPLPVMAYVFSVATTANLSLALLILCLGEVTWRLRRLSWVMYDWLLWAAIVFSVQSAAAFSASLGFEFYYGVTRRRGINLGVVSALFATASWIFLFWRTCAVKDAELRALDELLRRKHIIRSAGA